MVWLFGIIGLAVSLLGIRQLVIIRLAGKAAKERVLREAAEETVEAKSNEAKIHARPRPESWDDTVDRL